MASVTGSFLVFDKPVGDARPINLVLTPDGTGATTVAGSYNIEVFTSVAGTPGAGFDAAAFIQGAVQAVNPATLQPIPNEVRAGTTGSTEQLLATTLNTGLRLTDAGGTAGETISGGAGSNATIAGAAGDELVGGSGAGQVLNGLAGNIVIIQGTGDGDAVYGGAGDKIFGGDPFALPTSSAQIVGNAGSMSIELSSTVGRYTVASGAGDTITAAVPAFPRTGPRINSASVQIAGDLGDSINLANNGGANTIIATAGNETVVAGSGATNVFGATGDSVVAGANTYVDITAGKMNVTAAATGTDTFTGSAAEAGPDTISSTGAASVSIQSLGSGDIVNLAGSTGTANINATIGKDSVSAGSGATNVFGGAGDTINAGANTYVDGTAGGMTINLGATGADVVIGNNAIFPPVGDTITGTGAASLNYNPGGASGTGDVIDLSKSSGGGVINSFSAGGKLITAPGDTISVGTGATSVWGGGGDRIGVGNASSAGGTALFDHSTTIAGAKIGFGTNDTVQAVTYGSTPGAVTVGAGASTAKDSVTSFNSTTDTVFYASRSTTNQDTKIIATASTSGGNTTIVLPDGTTLTLVGVTSTTGLTFTS